MPSLSELQVGMAQALLADHEAARALPPDWFATDAERGLSTHRNTIVSACVHALALSYPTLERVLGEATFSALAAEFGRQRPPSAPALNAYGEGFADFIAARCAGDDQALLLDIARYDWQFERVAKSAAQLFSGRAFLLDGGVQLQLAASLCMLRTQYAVDELRSGAQAATPGLRRLVLWRRDAGVAVQNLGAVAADIVEALQSEGDFALVLVRVSEQWPEADIATAMQNEILRAGFVRLTLP